MFVLTEFLNACSGAIYTTLLSFPSDPIGNLKNLIVPCQGFPLKTCGNDNIRKSVDCASEC